MGLSSLIILILITIVVIKFGKVIPKTSEVNARLLQKEQSDNQSIRIEADKSTTLENPIQIAGLLLSQGATSILNSMIAMGINIVLSAILALMIGLGEIEDKGIIAFSIVEFLVSIYSISLIVSGFIKIKKSGQILCNAKNDNS